MHIAILTGGISAEREVALRSGANMADWVQKAGHTSEVFDFPRDIHQFLQRHQSSVLARHFPTKTLRNHLDNHQDFDLVIPMLHGIYGEDGQVTAFLKTLGYHYAYSPFTTHALCLDKYRTNLFVEKIGIKIPETQFIEKNVLDMLILDIWNENFSKGKSLIVKPNRGGSSIATSRVSNKEQLLDAIHLILDDDILVQECIEGREFTVGVYRDHDGYHTLPIMEIITHDGVLFDYSEKYETNGYNEIFPILDGELTKKLSEECERIAEVLHCYGVVRMDYRYDGKDIYFLEVNTIPGFNSGSFVPKMWKRAGKTEKEFMEMLNS